MKTMVFLLIVKSPTAGSWQLVTAEFCEQVRRDSKEVVYCVPVNEPIRTLTYEF